MTQLTRRGMLTGAAAITATALSLEGRVTGLARRRPRQASRRRASIVTRSATIEVTAVTDGARTFPLPDNFVRNAPKEAVERGARRDVHGRGQGGRRRSRRSS